MVMCPGLVFPTAFVPNKFSMGAEWRKLLRSFFIGLSQEAGFLLYADCRAPPKRGQYPAAALRHGDPNRAISCVLAECPAAIVEPKRRSRERCCRTACARGQAAVLDPISTGSGSTGGALLCYGVNTAGLRARRQVLRLADALSERFGAAHARSCTYFVTR